MPFITLKAPFLEMRLYDNLPDKIKFILGGPTNVEVTGKIIKESGLTEEFRPYINTLVFGLFVGELNPRFLTEAVKEWLVIDDAKSRVVASLIKKAFVDPHAEFLANLYQEKETPQKQTSSVPQGNVVNLKRSEASL
jgi:hypothetical protein